MATPAFPRIGFIGAGQMATAFIKGMLRSGLTVPERIAASDVMPDTRLALQAATGVIVHADNALVAEQSEVVVIAVKPQVMAEVMENLAPNIHADHLVVSIAAGVTLRSLADGLHGRGRLVRVMPNTPCLVGAGAAGYCLGAGTTSADAEVVERLLKSVGIGFRVPETQLDAVTGLSGSGPAFVAVMIEALSDAGVRVGLPRAIASALAAQTVLGTARLVREFELHPGALKDMVASPGGTTIAGLHVLEKAGIRGALMDAVQAATQRSVELGRQ